MIRTLGLTHVQLRVSDLARSVRFYKDAFGMEEQFREGDQVFLRTPGAQDTITLNGEANSSSIDGGAGIEHLGFRRAQGQDLDDAIREAQAAGGKLVERGAHAPGKPFAYIADPDGYLIEL